MEQELERQCGVEHAHDVHRDHSPPQPPKPAAEPPELLDLVYREAWTPRERQVAALVIRGYRNKEIATELGISEQAVKHHLHNMCAKIGATNRKQVAIYALRLGIR